MLNNTLASQPKSQRSPALTAPQRCVFRCQSVWVNTCGNTSATIHPWQFVQPSILVTNNNSVRCTPPIQQSSLSFLLTPPDHCCCRQNNTIREAQHKSLHVKPTLNKNSPDFFIREARSFTIVPIVLLESKSLGWRSRKAVAVRTLKLLVIDMEPEFQSLSTPLVSKDTSTLSDP